MQTSRLINIIFKIPIRSLLLIIIFSMSFQLFALKVKAAQETHKCIHIFDESPKINPELQTLTKSELSANELTTRAVANLKLVPEFNFIRKTAENLGVRVWLFGGTASSYLHYVKWDILRKKGSLNLQNDRFDYDYTNIFRSTQDLDVVIDAKPEIALAFQKIIADKYPQFLGAKTKWEVRTLRHRMGIIGDVGFKEALLNDPDFIYQNTDSNSLGMVELTQYQNEPIIRDLKNWEKPLSTFLEDTINNRISFFRSNKHFNTYRAIAGENPEILSVIRLLVKAFQYELTFSKTAFEEIRDIVNHFDGSQITNSNALRRIHDTSKKLVLHAVNIEYAMNILDQLGLRKKLIVLGDITNIDSDAWWLNREPLRSRPVGTGQGATAAQLDIKVVAHETNNFLAFESITRAHSGEPNVLISRANEVGETAVHGDGFYTKKGRTGARGTGLTIRFNVDPQAKEGTDFSINDDFIIFHNKKAISVIQESLNFTIDDLLKLVEQNQELVVEHSNLALLEKLKRKINASIINTELNKLINSKHEHDFERLIQIIYILQNTNIRKLISTEILDSVISNVYQKIIGFEKSNSEEKQIRYIQTIGPILNYLDKLNLLKKTFFINHLENLFAHSNLSFEFRKQVFFELALVTDNFEHFKMMRSYLSPTEYKESINEIKNWLYSENQRKINYVNDLNHRWSSAISRGNLDTIKDLIALDFFSVNHRNISDVSILQLAAYYKELSIIDWLNENREFDFHSKNRLGQTEIAQLRLIGKNELADKIIRLHPEIDDIKVKLKERNENGTPIIDFIRIEPGSFMMGDRTLRIPTTISKPFEFMSTHITDLTFKIIVGLLKDKFQKSTVHLRTDT
jgi:hypothetical protein